MAVTVVSKKPQQKGDASLLCSGAWQVGKWCPMLFQRFC